VTRPIAPFPKPVKKPLAPSSFAPFIGFVTTPLTP